MRKRAIIFLEPWEKARTSQILVAVDKLVRRLELNIMVLPRIKMMATRYNVKVYSPDFEVGKLLQSHGVNIQEADEYLSTDQTEAVKEMSRQLAQSWHRFDEVKDCLTFSGVDLGLAMEQQIMYLTYALLRRVELYRLILDTESPNRVYIENSQSPTGHVLKSICHARGIRCFSLYPEFYGGFKSRMIKRIGYKRYKSQAQDPVNLYSLENGVEDSPGAVSILVDAPYINYLAVILPVVEKFFLKSGCRIFVLAKETDLLRYDVKFSRCHIKIDKATPSEKYGRRRMTDCFSRLTAHQPFLDIFDYAEVNLWQSLKNDFYYLLREKAVALAQNLHWFNKLISITRPDIVLVGDDRGPALVCAHVLFAQAKNIPVVEIQHGVGAAMVPMATPISDKICAWGDFAKGSLEMAGAKDDQIVVTGSPKYDWLYQKVKERRLVSSPRSRKTILFATEPGYRNLNCQAIEEIGRLIKRREDISLVVKPHPGESGELYTQCVEELGERAIVRKDTENTDNMLIEASLVIIVSSTVGLDAAIADKPIILLNTEKRLDSPYSSISIEVRQLEELIPAIENLLDDDEVQERLRLARQKFVYELAYTQDGEASKRVADLIIQMVEESKREGSESIANLMEQEVRPHDFAK